MVGFLKRVSRITMGKINAFLDGAENPEEVLPLLLQELRQEHERGIEAEATAVAALKRRQRDLEEVEEDLARWSGRAEMAVTEGDDGLAAKAIEAQMAAERRLESAKRALQAAQVAADRAREARQDLQEKVHTLESRRDEILSRARAARQQEQVRKAIAGVSAGSGESILAAVARMEDKVAEAESRAAAYADINADMSGGDTEQRFRELERKHLVEDRLRQLKARLGKGPATDQQNA